MTRKAFDGIMAGLKDALAFAQGDRTRARLTAPETRAADVKRARKRLGLSQDSFARAFGVSASTVRKWEQGVRRPTGAARVLLRIIERRPDVVQEALRGGD
jgi:putative transcriptional regulator